MSKLGIKYLLITFIIMVLAWGTCVLCGKFGITFSNYKIMYLPYLLGGFSPTIASFIALKQDEKVKGFKNWLIQIFDYKQHIVAYLLPIFFAFAYFIPQILISGYDEGVPFLILIILIPLMLFGGGNEEVGWRHILQPELEKKLPFPLATIIVAIIWWLWHLPLFYIPGTGQYNANYFLFGINVLGISFALAAIKKNTGSTMLCIIFHCLVNALLSVFIILENLSGYIISASILIIVSFVLIFLKEQRLTLEGSK